MISKEQLSYWAKSPIATKYSYTYEQVKNALLKYLPDIAQKNHWYSITSSSYEVYLQWSYANSTNINWESDVDIVIELNSIFNYNIDQLTEVEKSTFHEHFSTSSQYKFSEFKKDVKESLSIYFLENIEYKNKCLLIPKNTLRVNADIIPCFSYRKYWRFSYYSTEKYVEWIQFFNTENWKKITNFPKAHKKNCSILNQDTEWNFKSMVRILKNIKKILIENNIIDKKSVCSYFIENLLYNCTPPCYDWTYHDQIIKIFQYLFDSDSQWRLGNFLCANWQDLLFSEDKWNLEDAKNFIYRSADYYLNN